MYGHTIVPAALQRWRGGGRWSALDLWRVMACSAACQRPLNPARSAAASVSEKLSGEYVPGAVLEVGGGGEGGGGGGRPERRRPESIHKPSPTPRPTAKFRGISPADQKWFLEGWL